MSAEPVIGTLPASLADVPSVDRGFALGLAAYAERVLVETDGMWPPHARATACREALRNVAAECRREASATPNEETRCPPR